MIFLYSLPQMKSKQSKAHEDPKKQKKFEKEEKEFRKKFKVHNFNCFGHCGHNCENAIPKNISLDLWANITLYLFYQYDGEIQVLHQVTVATSKKGSGKDLAVQAGENVDVISKSDPDKFICRNKEGKCKWCYLWPRIWFDPSGILRVQVKFETSQDLSN